MANTTNFNWETPDDTDLVKDGAAAIRTLGNSIDTSLVDLKGGTTGQVLSKASNTDMDFTWANGGDITEVAAGTGISGGGTSGSVTITNSMATTIDAKGDLIVGTADNAFARLASSGVNNQILTVDTSTSTGLKWATPSSPAYVGYRGRNTGSTTVGNSTYVEYTMNSESWDTDGFHSTTTNTGRVTIPTGKGGKYLVVWGSGWSAGFNTDCIVRNVLYVNGAQTEPFFEVASSTANLEGAPYGSQVMQLNEGDYLQLYYWQNSGTSKTLGNSGYLSVTYLGA